MKMVFSSSYQSKLPLILVSLFLFSSGRLNGTDHEETFAGLIAEQNSYQEKLSDPQLESTDNPLLITPPPFVEGNNYSVSPPPSFVIDLIIPSPLRKGYMAKKKSPFTGKKSINFNREIAQNEKSDPLIGDPNLELNEEKKYDFLSKSVPLDLEKPPLDSSKPYSFKYPQDPSPLIDRDLFVKKSIVSSSNPLKELHVAYPISSDIAIEEKKNVDLSPQHESLNKYFFNADHYHFYFDDSFPLTSPYPLDNELVFSGRLFQIFTPPKKMKCVEKCYFAENYFKSLKWANVSQLITARASPPLYPSLERQNIHFFKNQKSMVLTIPQTTSAPLSLEKFSLPFPFPYKNYTCKKMVLAPPFIDHQTFEFSPYLYIAPHEELYTPEYYLPTYEKATLLPTKYSLPAGPILTVELNGDVINFTLTHSFDLYCSEESISIPKKIQEFQESAFTLMQPYLYNSAYEHLDIVGPIPELEKYDPLTFNETIDTLNLTPNIDPSSSLSIGKEIQDEPLAIISHPIEFPHGKMEPLSMEFPFKFEHFFKSLTGEKEKAFIDPAIVANTYRPSMQKEKESFGKSIPEISIPKSKCQPFSLATGQSIPLTIHAEELDHEKYPLLDSGTLSLYGLPSLAMKGKEITPSLDGKSPKKVMEDIPGIETMAPSMERRGSSPNMEQTLLSYSSPSLEMHSLDKGDHPLRMPLRPAYYPPEIPNLDIMATSPSIKEEHLEYVKKKTTPSESSLNDLQLPYLAEKRIAPDKQLMTSKNAFEDISEADKVIDLTKRDTNFPITREIIENHPAPAKATTDLALAQAELIELETDMIRSQSKEILEDYEEENRLSAGLITLASSEFEGGPTENETRTFNQSNRLTQAFLTEIPPPSHLETVSYDNEFKTDIYYSRREDGKGYLFAIKIKPNEKLNFSSPCQHFIFVIDGSSSIKKHRFGVFKEGVGRALSYLREGDSFNIIVADSQLTPYSKTASAWNGESVAKAKRFLMDRNYRGFFINYNAFDLLSNVSSYFAPDKENIVVLITDGHSFSTLKDHKKDFKELTKASKGKFSVFTATTSQGNNLSMLDLLSTFNNGELMYSKTNASFSRQLSVLVKHIESFVAKDIHVNVTSDKQKTGVEFYPNENSLPSFYSDRPYMVYGCIDELKDFDLMLQGRYGDQWINIKQAISFKGAEKATHTIKKGIALQKAYVCYDYFLNDEDPFYLAEAQRILEPLRIPTATR